MSSELEALERENNELKLSRERLADKINQLETICLHLSKKRAVVDDKEDAAITIENALLKRSVVEHEAFIEKMSHLITPIPKQPTLKHARTVEELLKAGAEAAVTHILYMMSESQHSYKLCKWPTESLAQLSNVTPGGTAVMSYKFETLDGTTRLCIRADSVYFNKTKEAITDMYWSSWAHANSYSAVAGAAGLEAEIVEVAKSDVASAHVLIEKAKEKTRQYIFVATRQNDVETARSTLTPTDPTFLPESSTARHRHTLRVYDDATLKKKRAKSNKHQRTKNVERVGTASCNILARTSAQKDAEFVPAANPNVERMQGHVSEGAVIWEDSLMREEDVEVSPGRFVVEKKETKGVWVSSYLAVSSDDFRVMRFCRVTDLVGLDGSVTPLFAHVIENYLTLLTNGT